MDDYIARIKKCYAAAYNLHFKHKGLKTAEEFQDAWDEFCELRKQDPFLSDLLNAVYSELAREDKRQREINNS